MFGVRSGANKSVKNRKINMTYKIDSYELIITGYRYCYVGWLSSSLLQFVD